MSTMGWVVIGVTSCLLAQLLWWLLNRAIAAFWQRAKNSAGDHWCWECCGSGRVRVWNGFSQQYDKEICKDCVPWDKRNGGARSP